ncbi:hypothetical protein [Roseimarinus sediminis]|jgi:hypothetical protein|uniref:hypothetical protein n=1 Tax=Roseimarinus sediminis TaxID=1610899 RepID=UPI003D1E3F0C
MRNQLVLMLVLLCFGFLNSCSETRTEVFDGKEYYEGDQLAVVGYLSNKGVVVHVQKTQSALTADTSYSIVEDVQVKLLTSDGHVESVEFRQLDRYNFVSAESFIPEKNCAYKIEVSAPGLETVISEAQTVMSGKQINSVKLEIEERNFHVEDTTVYTLFGRPRAVWCSYFINNSDHSILNNLSRFLFRWNNELYEFKRMGDFQRYEWPPYFFNLEMGTQNYIDIPEIVSGRKYFYDQLSTQDSIDYNGIKWQVIDRIDEIVVQSVVFSADFVHFFEQVNEYLEQRSDPFSIMAEQIPSNMSNNIGYWGNVFIDEKVVNLPATPNDTITYHF